ncbi:MAG: hypothetical protein EHM42_15305, partial [Planctomycetaceae bacterium]
APGMLAFCLMSLLTSTTETGVFFLPAEVDLLFPGPFRRRDLLLYRIVGLAAGSAVVSLLFSALLLRCVPYWVAAYTGIFLSFLFLNLLQMSLALVISTIAELAYTRLRQGILIGVSLLVAGVTWNTFETGRGFVANLSSLRESVVARVILAPFEILGQTATASQLFPDFLGWGALALALNAALLALILKLDANYMEKSIGSSQRLYDRLQRARRGQGLQLKARGRLRPPRFAFLGGAGPIAWRQSTMALRSAHGVLLIMGIVVVALFVPQFLVTGKVAVAIAAPFASMAVFVLPQLLQFDFRSDVDRLDVLKSLPVSPWGVVLGQLFAPVCLSSIIVLAVVAGFGLSGAIEPLWVGLAGLVVIPANLFIFSLENLLFLLFPLRAQAVGSGDLQVVGRNMLSAVCKIIAMMAGFGIAAGIGGLTWWLTGETAAAWLIGSAGALLLLSAFLIPLIVLVFHRLDPATHAAD